MTSKKKIALATGVTAAALLIAGTFAWFSTTDSVKNIFGLDNFDVSINEDFDPSEVPMVPGADITKKITVDNGGNMDVLVRVKLEENLHLLDMDTAEGTDKIHMSMMPQLQTGKQYVPAQVSEEMIKSKTADGYAAYGETFTVTDAASSGADVAHKAKLHILQKTVKGNSTGNTVYSYFAYMDLDNGGHQVVKVTPTEWTNAAANGKSKPSKFTAEYGYNIWKDNGSGNEGTKYDALNITHGKATSGSATEDAKLDTYMGSAFHDAMILNFAENVQVDGAALKPTTTWYLAADGYFYYCKPLVGGSISAPLLESVKISDATGNALRGGQYVLTPVMEAIQKDHSAVPGTWTNLDNTDAVHQNSVKYSTIGAAAAVSDKTKQANLVWNVVDHGKGVEA